MEYAMQSSPAYTVSPPAVYREAEHTAPAPQSTPRICLLACEQDASTDVDDVRFQELRMFMDSDVQRNFSAAVSSFEPCRRFKTPLETPTPFGVYKRKDLVEWNDALPSEAGIRQQIPGPFEVWSATYFPDKYQGVILDVPGETDNFICSVHAEPLLRQKELVLIDQQTDAILIAPPGFFRHGQG